MVVPSASPSGMTIARLVPKLTGEPRLAYQHSGGDAPTFGTPTPPYVGWLIVVRYRYMGQLRSLSEITATSAGQAIMNAGSS